MRLPDIRKSEGWSDSDWADAEKAQDELWDQAQEHIQGFYDKIKEDIRFAEEDLRRIRDGFAWADARGDIGRLRKRFEGSVGSKSLSKKEWEWLDEMLSVQSRKLPDSIFRMNASTESTQGKTAMLFITGHERGALIRIASTLPVGDDTRTAILNGLSGLKNLGETQEASAREASAREAGRPWGGPGYKSKSMDYDIPPAQGGTGSPPCQPAGDGPCYRSHHEYGKAPKNSPGCKGDNCAYNKWYRENAM